MSSLIKSAEDGAVQQAAAHPFPRLKTAARAGRDALQDEIARLSREVATLGAQVEAARAQAQTAHQHGLQEGRALGFAEAKERHADKLKALGAGVAEAVALYRAEMKALQSLAIALAVGGLEKILGGADAERTLLIRTIRTQLSLLEHGAVVRVEISGLDFDDNQIPSLPGKLARPGLSIVRRHDLPAGACRIKLALGALEVGLDHQWPALKDLLTAHAGTGQ